MKNKITVMIVDDYALIRTAWKTLIDSSPNYEVVTVAKNGKEAVALYEEKLPALILMDITMPEMDGIEATTLICKNEKPPAIIGLTMHSEISYARQMLNAGARGYITKDCSLEELLKAMDKVMNGEVYITNHLQLFDDLLKEIGGTDKRN